MLEEPIFQFNLLFRASEHSFSAYAFHKYCDGKKNTLVLLRTRYGKILGGYTPIAWSSNSSYSQDHNRETFLFSISNEEKYVQINTEYGIYGNSSYGPTFGGGHDLYIADHCDTAENTSYFNFGYSYNTEDRKYVNGNNETHEAICGSKNDYYAKVEEY